MKSRKLLLAGAAAVGATLAGRALAVPGVYAFIPQGCDSLPLAVLSHELGTQPAFPVDELIDAVAGLTDLMSCPPTLQPQWPNVMVQMTNLTPTTWTDVYFVADPHFTITNFDGMVNGGQAFRIDNVGVNRPLVFESMAPDGVFQSGETWNFIVQNWQPLVGAPALPPLFGSIGVGGASLPGLPGDPNGMQSTASIVAVPESGSWAMLAAGLAVLGAAAHRRRGARRAA